MIKNYSVFSRIIVATVLMFLFHVVSKAQSTTVQSFSYTGSAQSFTVPACVYSMTVDIQGAQGGGSGGLGGKLTGVLTVTPGMVLGIYVGGMGGVQQSNSPGGFNGGGTAGTCNVSYPGAGGGGASDIRMNGLALSNRVMVAGGGGGSHQINNNPGVGGGLTGGNVGSTGNGCISTYATGGSQLAGGNSCTSSGSCCTFIAAAPASAGLGGNGSGPSGNCNNGDGGAGGGGGYFGGGGGGTYSAGAGGSSYSGAGVTGAVHTQGFRSGNGIMTFSFTTAGNGVVASASPTAICNGNASSLVASGMNSYTWSTGSNLSNISVNPTSTTSYTISGTNSVGCVSQSILTVTVSAGVPTLAVTSSTNQTCFGKTATLTANGALTYTWSNNVTNGVSFTPSVTNVYTVTGGNGCGTSTAVTSITVAPIPVNAVINPTLTCAGSGATLTATAAATTFTWLPNSVNNATAIVSPTSTTIYTITASDGTCAGTATVNLTVNPVPTVNIVSTTSVVCQGAAVTMTVSGGTSYVWSPGGATSSVVTFNPSGPTLYSVVATNSFNCNSVANQVVITNPSPTLVVTASDNLICSGSTSTITVTGANNYTWSTSSNTNVITVSPLTTTIYSVTGAVTGTPCLSTQTVQIAVFTPSVSVAGATAICLGNSSTLTASGADSYQWDNGAPVPAITVSPVSTTVYTVSALTATGNINCATTNTIQVVVNPNPTVNVVPTRTFMCIKENNTLTATGAPNYSWSTGATTNSIVVTSTIATSINYSVIGTDANGCKNSKVYQLKINGCTGLFENDNNKVFSIYPNPNTGSFVIEANADLKLSLYNELGQFIKLIDLNSTNNYTIRLIDISAGLYFISNGEKYEKIIVNK